MAIERKRRETHPERYPLSYTVETACRVTGLRASVLSDLIVSRQVDVVRVGKQTLILAHSLRALLGIPADV